MPTIRPDLETLPKQLEHLPIDDKGYPVPWFVGQIDGKFDFRAADARKAARAVRDSLCWVCGEKLGRYMTFVIGPMCSINRVSAEPPCHAACAEWSARNCPFLKNPRRTRREDEKINAENFNEGSPGIALLRNPGVICCWTTRSYQVQPDHKGNGVLFSIGDPTSLSWWAEGRSATRAEVLASVDSGFPSLLTAAQVDGDAGVAELYIAMAYALAFIFPQQ